MSVDLKALQELVQYTRGEHPVVSVYLNITPPNQYKTELNSLIRSSQKKLKDENIFDKEQLQALQETFSRIENYVHNEMQRKKYARLAVIFASPEGLWQVFQLPVPLPSRMAVEMDPYVRPLSVLLDEFDRYCVLVLDARKARIFSLYLGEFDEFPEVFMEQERPSRPSTSKSLGGASAGVKVGLGDEKLKSHIEDKIHRYLKDIASKTFDFFHEQEFNLLILGGPQDKTLPKIKGHLHSYLSKRLAGEFNARPEDKKDHLKQKALEVAQHWERKNEEKLIDSLLETHNSGGKAVLGLEPTLEALFLGQIHTLILDENFKVQGFVCPQDHHLSTYLQTCPVCQSTMYQVQDLADEMVEEAILQQAEIKHVFTEHQAFKPYSIGAFLRFTL